MKKRSKKRQRPAKPRETLRQMVRAAAKQGASEAIDHCQNFWNASDGYRRYIDANIKAEVDAMWTLVRGVVKGAVREELAPMREELASALKQKRVKIGRASCR